MPTRRYKSFEELARVQRKERPSSVPRESARVPGVRQIWVQMDVAAQAEASVAGECRSVALEWFGKGLNEQLPRRALRHRPFSYRETGVSCRVVRIRSRERDLWSVQVERMLNLGRQVATSLTVASRRGHPTRIAVEVTDRSLVPGSAAEEDPYGLVAEIAGRIPLLQNGRRFVCDPIMLDTEEAMRGFLDSLLDPMRDMPFAVVSIPPRGPDRHMLAEQWTGLARALAGLAVVWTLPPAMTFRLSDSVGKERSAFNGAWRFYRPGFSNLSDRERHPLVLANRLAGEGGLGAATTQFQRLAAEERLRFGTADRDTLGFDAVESEAAAAPRGLQKLVAPLRNAVRRDSAVAAQERSPADKPNGSGQPTLVSRSGSGQQGAATTAGGRGTRAGEGTRVLRRKPTETKEKGRKRNDHFEQAQRRAELAERENEKLRTRLEQLTGLARSLGGDPDAAIPFPIHWDQVADWCDQSLAGRVSLTGSARRELKGAEFLDVGLAARCLGWLGREYREGRLRGGASALHGRIREIDEGVFNLPCGGDSFECVWNGRRQTVDWHVKNGANTRNPRRCLRIYYFWDEDTRSVVIASMPSHRRNALT